MTGIPGIADLLDSALYRFDPLSVLNFGAAAAIALTAVLVLYWERGSRVSRIFAAFCLMFVLWAIGRGLLRLLADPAAVVGAARLVNILVMLGLPFLFQFTMMLLRSDRLRVQLIRLHWAIGALFAFASVGTPWVVAGVIEVPWGLEPVYGWAGWLAVAWTATMIGVAGVDGARAWRDTLPGGIERRRITLFVSALVLLALGFVDFLPALGLPVYPMAFVPIAAFTVVTAYITMRFGLVRITPQLVAGEVASLVRGGLLILDRDGIIQIVNPEAARLLSAGNAPLVGAPAAGLLGSDFEPERLGALANREGREGEREFLYQPKAGGQVRNLALSVVAVRDERARNVAYACLLRDVTEKMRLRQRRATDRALDSLTGLPDRAHFQDVLNRLVTRAAESRDFDYAVCIVGLDRLHVINEDLGVDIGDEVLMETARRLRAVMRSRDVVARIGGDEFGVLLDGAGTEAVPELLRRIQDSLQAPLKLPDHSLHLSASVGVADSSWAYASGAEVLRDAGIAMYRVKQAGGGGAQVIDRADQGEQRTRLESDLREALASKQLRVYYQPVVDVVEHRVAGFEALVRWQHPQRGLIMPGAFIDFAEKIGLAEKIDEQVMKQACEDLARIRAATHSDRISISFNIAEGCLRDPGFTKQLGEQLQRHSLDPSRVRIELLERVAMIGPIYSTLVQLRGLGLGLYIDDFGTGYSSLSRLHKLPITTLKIDREFVRAMTLGKGGEKAILAINALARSLGLEVIAEGAGEIREARYLRDLGCRYVQGWYFAPAVPYDTALDMVRDPLKHFGRKFIDMDAEWLALDPTKMTLSPVPKSGDTESAPKETLRARIGQWLHRP